MKILSLDIGDQWIGTALSDPLGIIATPYKTVTANTLDSFLQEILQKERIGCVVVGHPITLRGTESTQTLKVRSLFETLQKSYPNVSWVLWDERLTSRQADKIKQAKTKQEKIKSHSRAAALILESYLQRLSVLSNQDN